MKKLSLLFACIFLLEIARKYFFTDWIFIDGSLTILNSIITFFSFFALLFCIILLFKPYRWIKILSGIFFLIFFIGIAFGEIYPIDTLTEPVDVIVLRTDADGKKLIVREYKNVKTNEVIRDTVLVKDVFVFRWVYKELSATK